MVRLEKSIRHKRLQEELLNQPFLTDEDLSKLFSVSVQTIRLDRLALNIPELRERVKRLAQKSRAELKTLLNTEIIGELVDVVLGESGISLLKITDDMVFERSKIARGHYVFSQANSLALAILDTPKAFTGVANIHYSAPVHVGDQLVAKAEITRKRGNQYFVRVRTKCAAQEVFRAKFMMVAKT